jgi:cob(I)alamin adenosyltransferase
MVVLSKITTKTGDEGLTHLGDMSRVAKTDPRIEAVGAVAEANAVLGVARSQGLPPDLDAWTARLQHELFDLGADLATPLSDTEQPNCQQAYAVRSPKQTVLRTSPATIASWEEIIAQLAGQLGTLRGFILPGGPPAAAQLHLAVTIVRRAERAAWNAAQAHGVGRQGGINRAALVYLNRLSDLLFQMARAAGGETELWRQRDTT